MPTPLRQKGNEMTAIDLTTLTADELRRLEKDCEAERVRRARLCPNCGGETKAWHVHVCDERGGANVLMGTETANALCRTTA